MHLGVKGAWTKDMQFDWKEFRIKQQQEAVETMLDIFCSKTFVALLVWRIILDSQALGFSRQSLWCGSMSTFMTSLLVFSHLVGPFIRRQIHKHDIRVASVFQMSLLMLLQTVNLCIALSMDGELMQHRYFLSSQITVLVLTCSVAYVPLWIHNFVGVPINFIAWLLFHHMSGFCQEYGFAKGIIFGAGISVCVPICFSLRERMQWLKFQANRELDRQMEILEATQTALHSMLSSLWDASCTCDLDGVVSYCTPHLAQLFGGGKDLAGACLSGLAANDADRYRLQEFLKNAASGQQAVTLQFTARSQWPRSEEEDVPCTPMSSEVALYCIQLPPGATLHNSCPTKHGKNLFIGIKASAPDAGWPDASFTENTDTLQDCDKPVHIFVNSEAIVENSTIAVTDCMSLLHDGTSVVSSAPSLSVRDWLGLIATDKHSSKELMPELNDVDEQLVIEGHCFESPLDPSEDPTSGFDSVSAYDVAEACASEEFASGAFALSLDCLLPPFASQASLEFASQATPFVFPDLYQPTKPHDSIAWDLPLSGTLSRFGLPPPSSTSSAPPGLTPPTQSASKESEKESNSFKIVLALAETSDLRSSAPLFVPATLPANVAPKTTIDLCGSLGGYDTFVADDAYGNHCESLGYDTFVANDAYGNHCESLGGHDAMRQIMLTATTISDTLDYYNDNSWEIASPFARLEHYRLKAGTLDSLKKHLRDHAARCNSAKAGDIVNVLDMQLWPMKGTGGRLIWSTSASCQITQVLNEAKCEVLIQDMNPPFEYGRVLLPCFMFEMTPKSEA